MSETTEIDLPDIVIVGACTIADKTGRSYAVPQMFIEARSYCCDLFVEVTDGPYDLCQDNVFMANVNGRLREVGYVGPDIGRGEMGAQEDGRLSLETTVEFEFFAIDRGWEYADGNDELMAGRLLGTLPYAALVSFKASNGAVYGVPIETIARHHAETHLSGYPDLPKALVQLTLPLFRVNHSAIIEWLTQHMTWDDFGGVVRVIKEPAEIDVRAEFEGARKSVRGLPTFGAQQT